MQQQIDRKKAPQPKPGSQQQTRQRKAPAMTGPGGRPVEDSGQVGHAPPLVSGDDHRRREPPPVDRLAELSDLHIEHPRRVRVADGQWRDMTGGAQGCGPYLRISMSGV